MPIGSIATIRSLRLSSERSLLGCRKNNMMTSTTAPQGKLIQKLWQDKLSTPCCHIRGRIYHQRQLRRSASTPPMGGPEIVAIPIMADIKPRKPARFASGIIIAITFTPPENIAEAPNPDTARPPMSIGDEFAAAQRTDPISNIKMPNINVHLVSK